MTTLTTHVILFAMGVVLTGGALWIWQRRDEGSESAPGQTIPLRRWRTWASGHRYQIAGLLAAALLVGYVAALRPRDVISTDCGPIHTFCQEQYERARTTQSDALYLIDGPVARPPFVRVDQVWTWLTDDVELWFWLWPVIGAVGVLVFAVVGWRSGGGRQVWLTAGLLSALAVGVEGQLYLATGRTLVGGALYAVAAIGFAAWLVIRRPNAAPEITPTPKVTGREIGLLLLVLALTILVRFAYLGRIPYGIEGDESNWTTEIVGVMLEGQYTKEAHLHYKEPVSYYMQAPFHQLLGPSILAARTSVAVYNVLGSLAFYWLVRQVGGWRMALLATLLMAVSLVDVSAARMALVEAHVKAWGLAGLAGLTHGVRTRRPFWSLAGGVSLALGVWTYETNLPLVGVAIAWAVILLISHRAAFSEWVRQLTAFLLPLMIVAPFVAAYMDARSSYYNLHGRLDVWQVSPILTFRNSLREVVQNFWWQTYGDFFFIRHGAIVNGILVPFLVLGLVLALANVRKPRYILPLLWFVLVFFPVPIYTLNPAVRVIYPGFPAIYFLIALSGSLVWREVEASWPGSLRPAQVAIGGLALAGLVALNLSIYFNRLQDPVDRLIRREYTDVVTQGVAGERRVYIPFVDGDAGEWEQHIAIMEAQRAVSGDQAVALLWFGSHDECLAALAAEPTSEEVTFIFDRSQGGPWEEAEALLSAAEACTDVRLERQGQWFDLYVIDGIDEQAAACLATNGAAN